MKQISSYINEKLIINKDTSCNLKTIDSFKDLYTLIHKTAKESQGGTLSLPFMDVSNLKDISYLCPTANLFEFNIKKIDFSNWNVNGVKNMEKVFLNLDVEEIDVTGWDVKTVENTQAMFWGCKKLKSIKGIDSWELKDMSENNIKKMFDNCPDECKPKWAK